jgi:hypothetical protein
MPPTVCFLLSILTQKAFFCLIGKKGSGGIQLRASFCISLKGNCEQKTEKQLYNTISSNFLDAVEFIDGN